MRVFIFLVTLTFSACAERRTRDGMIPIKKFKIAPPVSGTYAPWRKRKDAAEWYAGEMIDISESTFRYSRFSDAIDPARPEPDYSGKLSIFDDHIYLGPPDIPSAYRVSGLADGAPVLLTLQGYEQWKKEKSIFELNLLYLQKNPRPKK